MRKWSRVPGGESRVGPPAVARCPASGRSVFRRWGPIRFHETNLRTYVRLGDRDPGVWFFNLEAANSIAVRLRGPCFIFPTTAPECSSNRNGRRKT